MKRRMEPPASRPPMTSLPPTARETRIIRPDQIHQRLVVPIRPHVEAEVFVPYPMTEADWGQFLAVLAAMKPGLVPEPDTATCENRP